MANTREVRLRIRSVKSIAQVTRALQAVSASQVRKAIQAVVNTQPYAEKAWQVLTHIARQPERDFLHPLLTSRPENRRDLVILISGDRGLAGAYNVNVVRFALSHFDDSPVPICYVAVGRKGRDMLIRRRKDLLAEFSHLPVNPTFMDVSAIGRLATTEFIEVKVDRVFLVYTNFINLVKQEPVLKQLLPLEVGKHEDRVRALSREYKESRSAYIYEPGAQQILDQIVPRFTELQVYQAILESMASEHAARMVAMKNATDSAFELVEALQLEYNKVRQQNITNEMLDIAGGAEALVQTASRIFETGSGGRNG